MAAEVLLYRRRGARQIRFFRTGIRSGPDRQDAFWKENAEAGPRQKRRNSARRARGHARKKSSASTPRSYVERVDELSAAGGRPPLIMATRRRIPPFYRCVRGRRRRRASKGPWSGVMSGEVYRTFQPIGGLHHARARQTAPAFCVFNDCGVVIDTLRAKYGIRRVAYVDIDVHHGRRFFIIRTRRDPRSVRRRYPRRRHVFSIPAPATRRKPARAGRSTPSSTFPCSRVPANKLFHARVGTGRRIPAPLATGIHRVPVRRRQSRRRSTRAPEILAGRAPRMRRRAFASSRMNYRTGASWVFGGGGYNRTNLALAWNAVLNEIHPRVGTMRFN